MNRREHKNGGRTRSVARLGHIAVTLSLALFVALVVASSSRATTVTFESTFVSSTTGTTAIGVGETISFEQWVTIPTAMQVSSVGLHLTGDLVGALTSPGCSDNIAGACAINALGLVTNWVFAGSSRAKAANVGVVLTSGPEDELYFEGPPHPGLALGQSAFLPFIHLFGVNDTTRYEGNGFRSLIGTVSITANAPGQFLSGTIALPQLSGAFGYDATLPPHQRFVMLPTKVIGGSYSVHAPEPGSAALMAIGLTGLSAMRRRRK